MKSFTFRRRETVEVDRYFETSFNETDIEQVQEYVNEHIVHNEDKITDLTVDDLFEIANSKGEEGRFARKVEMAWSVSSEQYFESQPSNWIFNWMEECVWDSFEDEETLDSIDCEDEITPAD